MEGDQPTNQPTNQGTSVFLYDTNILIDEYIVFPVTKFRDFNWNDIELKFRWIKN